MIGTAAMPTLDCWTPPAARQIAQRDLNSVGNLLTLERYVGIEMCVSPRERPE